MDGDKLEIDTCYVLIWVGRVAWCLNRVWFLWLAEDRTGFPKSLTPSPFTPPLKVCLSGSGRGRPGQLASPPTHLWPWFGSSACLNSLMSNNTLKHWKPHRPTPTGNSGTAVYYLPILCPYGKQSCLEFSFTYKLLCQLDIDYFVI